MAHILHQRILSVYLVLSALNATLLSKCLNLHGRNVDKGEGFLAVFHCRGGEVTAASELHGSRHTWLFETRGGGGFEWGQ